jgi:hypothetical protein
LGSFVKLVLPPLISNVKLPGPSGHPCSKKNQTVARKDKKDQTTVGAALRDAEKKMALNSFLISLASRSHAATEGRKNNGRCAMCSQLLIDKRILLPDNAQKRRSKV